MDKCMYSMFMITLLFNWMYYMTSGFFPLYLQENKNISVEMTGYILSSQTFIGIFISVFFAHYTKYFNRNNLILFSICLSGVVNILFLTLEMTDDQDIIIAISFTFRLINGIGFAIGNQTIYSYIPILYKNDEVYKYGVLESAASIGQIFGFFIGSIQYQYGGIQLPYCTIGSLILCTIPLIYLFFPKEQIKNDTLIQKNIKFTSIMSRQTIGLIITCIMLFITENIYDATLSVFLLNKYELSEWQLGSVFALISTSCLLGIQFLNLIKNQKFNEFYIFLGLVFPAFGIAAFGGQIFFIDWNSIYVIGVGIFLVGFFESFFIILFIPVLMEKIRDIYPYPDDQVSDYANAIFQFSFLGGFTIGPSLGSILTANFDFVYSTKICMYAQLILAFLYLVLFSDIIFKNKNKVEKISLQEKMLETNLKTIHGNRKQDLSSNISNLNRFSTLQSISLIQNQTMVLIQK